MAKYCQKARSPNYLRVNQYSTSQNLFPPISFISTLITFSTSAGPPKGSPGIVLAKIFFNVFRFVAVLNVFLRQQPCQIESPISSPV